MTNTSLPDHGSLPVLQLEPLCRARRSKLRVKRHSSDPSGTAWKRIKTTVPSQKRKRRKRMRSTQSLAFNTILCPCSGNASSHLVYFRTFVFLCGPRWRRRERRRLLNLVDYLIWLTSSHSHQFSGGFVAFLVCSHHQHWDNDMSAANEPSNFKLTPEEDTLSRFRDEFVLPTNKTMKATDVPDSLRKCVRHRSRS